MEKPYNIQEGTYLFAEARETSFWLRLIADTNDAVGPTAVRLRDEADQITAILTTIRRNAGGGQA